MLNDKALAKRSIYGFGGMFASLGRSAVGPEAEICRENAIGARLDTSIYHPFFSSAVVPLGAKPPEDDPSLPHYIWTIEAAAPGRVAEQGHAIPCMGLDLGDPALNLTDDHPLIEAPSLAVLGEMNERVYGEEGFAGLATALRDTRVQTHGLRDGDRFVCVAMTFAFDDDLSIHYVATEETHRRRGLASRLIRAVLARSKAEGMRSATLQASEDGLHLWTYLGFRRVATVQAFIRA